MAKQYNRKKPVVSGTISPLHKKKIDRLVETGEFASISDFINQAVSDLLKKYEHPVSFSPVSGSPLTEEEIALLRSIIREKEAQMKFKNQSSHFQ